MQLNINYRKPIAKAEIAQAASNALGAREETKDAALGTCRFSCSDAGTVLFS